MSASGPGSIVVGVDGSEASEAALAWAVRQGELTGDGIVAVTVWDWPMSYGVPVPVPSDFDPEADAAKVAEKSVAAARQGHPEVAVEIEVLQGNAARVLVEHSVGADLLVVGSRGHGEFAGLLIGSVSEHCVAHAHCPVVVMRS